MFKDGNFLKSAIVVAIIFALTNNIFAGKAKVTIKVVEMIFV